MKSKQKKLATLFSIVGMILFVLSFATNAKAVVPPFNDNFAGANEIGPSFNVFHGTTVDATKQTGEPNHAGNGGGKSVWFKYVASPTANFSITFETLDASTSFDTLLAVYTGSSVNNLTPVVSNDDFGIGTRSRVSFTLHPNTTYYIAIDGFSGASGMFRLGWSFNLASLSGSDFNGAGSGDIAVFRPSNGTWYARDAFSPILTAQQWGQSGDIPVPADYDGDQRTDFAVFRPSNGAWYVLRSSNNTLIAMGWGANGDKPVQGDYNADGMAELGVWRPSNGNWYLYNLKSNTYSIQQFGQNGDKPAHRDYDGDGKLDLAVFRPSAGYFYILNSFDSSFRAVQWGQSGDIPVVNDFSDAIDGKADIAVWRPSNGAWYILSSADNTLIARQWGQNGDIPQPSTYSGGANAFTVYRPGNSTMYIYPNTSIQWGASGDIPVSSAYRIEP